MAKYPICAEGYLVRGKIGEGAFAEVYKAKVVGREELVAVKVKRSAIAKK